jgi:hypothetical protein
MPSQEEINQQQKILSINRRNLAHLTMQAASYGGENLVPLHNARHPTFNQPGWQPQTVINVSGNLNQGAPAPPEVAALDRTGNGRAQEAASVISAPSVLPPPPRSGAASHP